MYLRNYLSILISLIRIAFTVQNHYYIKFFFSWSLFAMMEGGKHIYLLFVFLHLTMSSGTAEAQVFSCFQLDSEALQPNNIICFSDWKQQIVCSYSLIPFEKKVPSCLQELILWGQGTGRKYRSLRRLGNKIE